MVHTLRTYDGTYRYCRLCALELQVLDDEMTEGQQNVFHALQREGEDDEEFEEEPKAQGMNDLDNCLLKSLVRGTPLVEESAPGRT